MSGLRVAIGFAGGLALLLAMGELYSRTWPPTDMLPFLGENSPLSGPYRSDPVLGADYASFGAFRALYADRFDELGPLASPRRTWLWLGNSFVQAPGMLGDTAAGARPDIRMFYLKRNEPLHLRVAQARQLLDAGLRAERILFVMLPIDVDDYQRRPLSWIDVNSRGAITYATGDPPFPLDGLISASSLVRIAWVRNGGNVADRSFRPADVTADVPSRLFGELAAMLGALADAARTHEVPVTLILLPNREQILGKGGFALQDRLIAIARTEGMDVFDARTLFAAQPDKRAVFLPDWHFTAAANREVLEALLAHIATKRSSGLPSSGASR